MTDAAIVEAMLSHGGNFVHQLARAYQAADAENQQRLKAAFADAWLQYAHLAELIATRKQAP